MISKTEEYALRAVVYLAQHNEEGSCRAGDIAESTEIPANYLSKILHQLGRHRIVDSERGRHGGFQLARPAAEISLADVIEPFGSLTDRGRCLLGRRECSDESPCGAHERWKEVRAATVAFFAGTTIADVMGTGTALYGPHLRGRGARGSGSNPKVGEVA